MQFMQYTRLYLQVSVPADIHFMGNELWKTNCISPEHCAFKVLINKPIMQPAKYLWWGNSPGPLINMYTQIISALWLCCRCVKGEGEIEKLQAKVVELRRKLDDTTAAMQELGRENQSLQVSHKTLNGVEEKNNSKKRHEKYRYVRQ